MVEKLRERGSLRTEHGDNLHGSTNSEKSLSFEEGRGVRKKMLRFSPRHGSKLYLSSSTTSVGWFPKITLRGSVKNDKLDWNIIDFSNIVSRMV